tara:strand:+ start:95 stop:469 length:375 start_codon:yes stop_codon:yes gene_type:complete
MDRVLKTIFGLTVVACMMMLVMSMDRPVIKKLGTYRGDHFPGFAEFRVQEIEWDDYGDLMLMGEPYDVLLNVNYITKAYRFEDGKKTDYSTLIFTEYSEKPILLRQEYKDVLSSIRRGMEAQVK